MAANLYEKTGFQEYPAEKLFCGRNVSGLLSG
jgi:hypothetical protein